MGLAIWLKERRLERTHSKLKRLRAIQSRLRDQETDLQKTSRDSAPSTSADAKVKKLHEERERITKEIAAVQAEEEKLKLELKAA